MRSGAASQMDNLRRRRLLLNGPHFPDSEVTARSPVDLIRL